MPSPTSDLPLPKDDTVNAASKPDPNQAAEIIRKKLNELYTDEPKAKEELEEIKETGTHSKHQKYMLELSNSGKSLAEIQTAWHNYYINLPNNEKHAVWQEFYENHARAAKLIHTKKVGTKAETLTEQKPPEKQTLKPKKQLSGSVEVSKSKPQRTTSEVKEQILNKVTARGKLQKSHHVQSLLFGVGMGLIVVFIFMFGFFNERFLAPLVTPSKNVSNTPIIVDPNAGVVSLEPKIIIPKINVEVPVNYDVKTINEKEIQNGLESGVVHYPSSPTPGQNGNVAIVGHSSNNIFNRGKYKFAFVLLNRLQEGDTFMLNYNGQRYIYKIYTKKIVKPNEVSVLGSADRPATATLITCDPPGTAANRLVVIGEQISPSPKNNTVATTNQDIAGQPAIVPGNAESLFQRMFGWLF